MDIPLRYIVVYYSSDGYQIEDFDTLEQAVEFCCSGKTYTSNYFIAKRVDWEVREHD